MKFVLILVLLLVGCVNNWQNPQEIVGYRPHTYSVANDKKIPGIVFYYKMKF